MREEGQIQKDEELTAAEARVWVKPTIEQRPALRELTLQTGFAQTSSRGGFRF